MIGSFLVLIVYLVVIALLCWLAIYVATNLGAPPDLLRIIRVVAVVIAVILACLVLLDLVGGGVDLGLPGLHRTTVVTP